MSHLPPHIIDKLNHADEYRAQAVSDAVTKARYEERDRFQHERAEMAAALKIFDLLMYDPRTDYLYVDPVTLADHRLSKYFRGRS